MSNKHCIAIIQSEVWLELKGVRIGPVLRCGLGMTRPPHVSRVTCHVSCPLLTITDEYSSASRSTAASRGHRECSFFVFV